MAMAPPLDARAVLTILHYISPTIQTLPPHLVASQLAFRQTCLKLTPDDPAYLFWPSDNDQHVLDALESLQQRPIDDISLDFQIRYTADDALCAHIDLAPTGLRLVFQWEEDSWRYRNAALMPFPPGTSASLDDLPAILPSDGDSGDGGETVDSYWNSYGEPDREATDAEFVREQPGATVDYWDRYNSVGGSGDSVIPSPAPEKQRHDFHPIEYSYAEMHPPTDPIESLSDRLAALPQRPHAPDDETVVDDSPPSETRGVDALKESLRGVYRLWQSTQPEASAGDTTEFLRVVREVLAES
ncbi:hypothetical protein B0H17DRAFT_1035902 [Mycena rosella]|uniref:Uncharacterized protein n=1 Tax=Mycena rosella TaxID=1033263 RepID=A0AAD7GVQ5_MYCRO|nr:hypothetical protein B0H17DRAFT_1035902 [Mycena rosella]